MAISTASPAASLLELPFDIDLDTEVDESGDDVSAELTVDVVDEKLADEALEALEDELEELDDDRDLEDFDLVELVADLDIYNLTAAMDGLEVIRAPYIRAARRAGKKSPAAEYYNAVNAPLFERRLALQADLDGLGEVAEADRDINQRVGYRRAAREMEALTDLIVRFNYGMTRSYVKKFTSNTSRDDSDDFQGAATVGLMRAISTFDPKKGRFGSWAFKPIQREVLRAVRDSDYPNLNPGDFERRPDILRAYQSLAGENGEYNPTFEEVAAACAVKVTREQVARVLDAPHLESLHAHVGDEGDTELGDLIADDADSVEDSVIGGLGVAALMDHGLTALDAREHFVLVRRYGLDGEPGQCLSSIGKQLKLSREAVRQIEAKALSKMLHPVVLRKLVRQGRR
ncbi:MAG: sigma-70 family RNA polymerase sigma factor [Nocardioidaceae bacterium]